MDPIVLAQAEAWIELTGFRERFDDAPDDLFERGWRLNDEVDRNPSFAWEVIKNIVARYEERDLFCEADNDTKQVLCNLAAGPLEGLLARHGKDYISALETEARRDRRFRWTLGGVWQSSISDDVWARIQIMTGGFSP
jgi:hypothetical protein